MPRVKRFSRSRAVFLSGGARWACRSTCYVDFVYQPIKDADGKVTGIFVEGVDVTARALADTALRDADRRKDEFLAMLAHELRNPLAPIRTAAEVLRSQGG